MGSRRGVGGAEAILAVVDMMTPFGVPDISFEVDAIGGSLPLVSVSTLNFGIAETPVTSGDVCDR